MAPRLWPVGIVLAATAAAASTACSKRNPAYCCTDEALCLDVGGVVQGCTGRNEVCDDDGALEGTPHTCVPDPATTGCDGPDDCGPSEPTCIDQTCGPCEIDDDCARFADTPVCGAEGACVECHAGAAPAESIDCPAGDPVCTAAGACRGCADHRECASGACDLATGACVTADDVVYVDRDASGGDTACTAAEPCQTIADGLLAATGPRRHVVIAAGDYDDNIVVTDRDLTIVGYGATMTAALNAPAVEVGATDADVAVWGLTITESPTGVQCFGMSGSTVRLTLGDVTITGSLTLGLDAFRCAVVMTRSRVLDNDDGGAQIVNGDFDITNSVFADNGSDGGFGGVYLDQPVTADVRFAFNTVVGNTSAAGTAAFVPGIRCEPTFALPALHSNIVRGNTGGDGAQVTPTGLCSYEHSLIEPAEDGTGNITGDPALDATYHLGAGSAALGGGRPDSGVIEDIDRDVRSTTAPDIGADEAD
jgi:hypothetical protein